MDGVLVVDKPAGMTSHDVVARVRKLLSTKKVGHAGTLDPDATGVLVLGIGKATRLLSFSQAEPKTYETTAVFGVETTTQDASGEVVAEKPAAFSRDELTAAMQPLIGDIEQIPPMVSAVKVGGERLYKKALRGETVERAARPVTIYEFELRDWRPGDRPEADLFVKCSAGTYIRTLVHDLGQILGSGAHLNALRRVGACGFDLNDAVALEDVDAGSLKPIEDAVRALPRHEVDAESAVAVSHGRALPFPGELSEDEHIAVMHEGHLLAVYRRRGAELVPQMVIPS